MADVDVMDRIAQAVLNLQPAETGAAVEAALQAGARPVDVIDRGIVPGMEAVGERYQREEVFLPDLLMAEQCIKGGLAAIEAHAGEDSSSVVEAAQRRLAERAASWMPALSSCVTRLLHSSDSFLKVKSK